MQRPHETFIGRGLTFGEALWCGQLERLQRAPPWHGLRNFRAVSLGPVVRGRAPVLLVLGGCGVGGYGNGVWRSVDAGVSWEEVSPNDEGYVGNDGRVLHRKWCGRESFAAAGGWTEDTGTLQGLVYVVGGLGPSAPMGDVWASEDLGKTFLCTCSEAPFGRRVGSGLAVCPGFPQRLVLVGGGWGPSPDRWDCWLSLDAGEHWTEVETPENSLQRRQPALFFPWRGTLVVLGGRDQENGPFKDAYAAKVQWQRRTALWRPLQVNVAREVGEESLDMIPWDECPWFLSHFTVYDPRTGEFVGMSGLASKSPLAVGRLPKRLLLGPLERTPGKTGTLVASVRTYPSRLPGDEEEDMLVCADLTSTTSTHNHWEAQHQAQRVQAWVASQHTQASEPIAEGEQQNRRLFEYFCNPAKHALRRQVKLRASVLESTHALLAADSMRFFFIKGNGVWSSSGYQRQVRLLERIGQQAHLHHGLVPEAWHRVLLSLLGGKRCAPCGGGGAGGAVSAGSASLAATSASLQAAPPRALQISAVEAAPPLEDHLPPAALAEPECAFFIAGTWDNFKLRKMAWDGSALVYLVAVGPSGRESFQILQDGRWELALYPSIADGNPFTTHVLMGPDSQGHGKNWTIGHHENDKGPRGSCYRVELHLRKHTKRPGKVEWKNVGISVEAEEAKAETLRRVQSIAKAREQKDPGRQANDNKEADAGLRSTAKVEPLPWNVPAALGGAPPPLAASAVDVREPLLLLGSCNNWNVEEAKEKFRFKRHSGGEAQGYQESRLIVRCPKESFEFQVVSARRLWDWRLYPSGDNMELTRGMKDQVQVGLFVGTDHEDLHGKNFRVRKSFGDKIYIMVSLSASDGLHVWCE